jgi:hypothetical protein
MKLSDRSLVLAGDGKDQPVLADRQMQPVGARRDRPFGARGQAEAVFLQEIEDGHAAFLFDLGRRTRQPLVVDLDMADAVGHWGLRPSCAPCPLARAGAADQG